MALRCSVTPASLNAIEQCQGAGPVGSDVPGVGYGVNPCILSSVVHVPRGRGWEQAQIDRQG